MSALTINSLPDELLELISISAGPTEYCNFRRAMKRIWLYTTGREDHCIKHSLVTEINKRGTTITTLCGKRHSMFDKPAIIYSSGTQCWYQRGKYHRDNDLPAIIQSDGTQKWFHRGEKHRDNNLPAVISADGTQVWYRQGKRHRDNDQPVIIHPDGRKEWYRHSLPYSS